MQWRRSYFASMKVIGSSRSDEVPARVGTTAALPYGGFSRVQSVARFLQPLPIYDWEGSRSIMTVHNKQ
jgi:hypothetical protein